MKLKANKPTNHEYNDRLHTDAAIKTWWSAMRWKYNKGLVLAGVLAFVIYATVASILLAPYEPDFEITLFTIVFQGFCYLFMMLIANLFYNLGSMMDRHFNRDNNQEFRELLYNMGCWFLFRAEPETAGITLHRFTFSCKNLSATLRLLKFFNPGTWLY